MRDHEEQLYETSDVTYEVLELDVVPDNNLARLGEHHLEVEHGQHQTLHISE
jgi:hypothetical protein